MLFLITLVASIIAIVIEVICANNLINKSPADNAFKLQAVTVLRPICCFILGLIVTGILFSTIKFGATI